MEPFSYFCDLSLYSSSMVGDSLIACDKAGAIHMLAPAMDILRPDHFKKDVKFYPVDDVCFTSADLFKGIRVWDKERGEEVYSYREDSIRMHTYSKEGCLGAVGDGCVKLYDLRVRYSVGVMPLSMCWMAEWGDGRIYCISSECIAEYDIRNTSGIVSNTRSESSIPGHPRSERKVCGVQDFISIDGGEFCTVRRGDTTYLLRLDESTPAVEEATRRMCVGDRMVKVKDGCDDFVIGVPSGNRMGFYEYRDTWMCEFGEFKNIEYLWFGRDSSYVFADRKVYVMEGGYERFKDLVDKK